MESRRNTRETCLNVFNFISVFCLPPFFSSAGSSNKSTASKAQLHPSKRARLHGSSTNGVINEDNIHCRFGANNKIMYVINSTSIFFRSGSLKRAKEVISWWEWKNCVLEFLPWNADLLMFPIFSLYFSLTRKSVGGNTVASRGSTRCGPSRTCQRVSAKTPTTGSWAIARAWWLTRLPRSPPPTTRTRNLSDSITNTE